MFNTHEPPLRRFLRERGVSNVRIYSMIRKSRSQFDRILSGRSEPRRSDMVNVLWAVREVLRDSAITMEQIFDLDPASAGNRKRIAETITNPNANYPGH